MTQPIQTTAAIAHLRRTAIAARPGVGLQDEIEWRIADLIETMIAHAYTQSERIAQAFERIEAMRAALYDADTALRGVIAVADRKTAEFGAARAARRKIEEAMKGVDKA